MTPRKEAPGVTPYNFLSCLGLQKLCSPESNATKTFQRSECILGCLVFFIQRFIALSCSFVSISNKICTTDIFLPALKSSVKLIIKSRA